MEGYARFVEHRKEENRTPPKKQRMKKNKESMILTGTGCVVILRTGAAAPRCRAGKWPPTWRQGVAARSWDAIFLLVRLPLFL